MILAATDYPVAGAFWTLLMFFTFVIWLWLLFTVFSDLFQRHDVGGWGKGLWVIGLIIFPYFGVLIYLIAQHKGMQERAVANQKAAKAQFDDYVKSAAGTGSVSPADELHKAKSLLDSGAINQDEFDKLKAKALA
jgi:hypothetical protein